MTMPSSTVPEEATVCAILNTSWKCYGSSYSCMLNKKKYFYFCENSENSQMDDATLGPFFIRKTFMFLDV